ncbi:nucleotide exchange factor GrpE [Paludifilum halophilum]|uniref:Protein GrpE n=1 Tax=Paludifilum halophilum TaxID=1642702 RepID=A0A235B5Z7_9BACL|nr:nucleotide exchange factor GrpE [Paludifilum halophilum]OYD07651.1 nucleotide exchange factor GrpE [Paludifilum halophilum]
MTSKDSKETSANKRPITARELRKAKEAEERAKEQAEKKAATEEGALHNAEPAAPEQPEAQQQESPKREDPGDSPAEEAAVYPREEELLREVEQWKQKAEENNDLLLKARADLENFRRRARKDKEETAKYAAVSLVESLLPVLDNLERALAAGGEGDDSEALYQGVDMVYRQLLQALTDQGLSEIKAEGEPFNPHEHNAVMEEENDEVESGIVIQELQKGYRFKERVIRPSMVKVSS